MSYQPEETAVWGSAEVLPNFLCVTFEATQEQAAFILGHCHYDGTNFIHTESGEVFSLDMLIPDVAYTDMATGNLALAQQLGYTGGVEPRSVCDFLCPQHQTALSIYDLRKYWFRKFFPYRAEPTVTTALEAIKAGAWWNIRAAFVQVPSTVYQQMHQSLTEADWIFLTIQWEVNCG